jgi:hypothetical protein
MNMVDKCGIYKNTSVVVQASKDGTIPLSFAWCIAVICEISQFISDEFPIKVIMAEKTKAKQVHRGFREIRPIIGNENKIRFHLKSTPTGEFYFADLYLSAKFDNKVVAKQLNDAMKRANLIIQNGNNLNLDIEIDRSKPNADSAYAIAAETRLEFLGGKYQPLATTIMKQMAQRFAEVGIKGNLQVKILSHHEGYPEIYIFTQKPDGIEVNFSKWRFFVIGFADLEQLQKAYEKLSQYREPVMPPTNSIFKAKSVNPDQGSLSLDENKPVPELPANVEIGTVFGDKVVEMMAETSETKPRTNSLDDLMGDIDKLLQIENVGLSSLEKRDYYQHQVDNIPLEQKDITVKIEALEKKQQESIEAIEALKKQNEELAEDIAKLNIDSTRLSEELIVAGQGLEDLNPTVREGLAAKEKLDQLRKRLLPIEAEKSQE